MRGLTKDERAIITCARFEQAGTFDALMALADRGLVSLNEEPNGISYNVKDEAYLALRLDAAARGVSA